MPEVKWNSTTIPEEGAIVYVLGADDRGLLPWLRI